MKNLDLLIVALFTLAVISCDKDNDEMIILDDPTTIVSEEVFTVKANDGTEVEVTLPVTSYTLVDARPAVNAAGNPRGGKWFTISQFPGYILQVYNYKEQTRYAAFKLNADGTATYIGTKPKYSFKDAIADLENA